MRIRNAIRSALHGLSLEEKRGVAERIGVSVSTLYQYAEDATRCHLRVDQVAEFCAATGSAALLEAVQSAALEALDRERQRGQMHLPGTVTETELERGAHEIESAVWNAAEDGVVTAGEIKGIWVRVNGFVRGLARFEWGRGRRRGMVERRVEKF